MDKYGFGLTFCTTALLQGVAVCMLLPLLLVVPQHDGQSATSSTVTEAVGVTGGRLLEELDAEAPKSELQQPLLRRP